MAPHLLTNLLVCPVLFARLRAMGNIHLCLEIVELPSVDGGEVSAPLPRSSAFGLARLVSPDGFGQAAAMTRKVTRTASHSCKAAIQTTKKLALWLVRIGHAVFELKNVPADAIPAAHRAVALVWRRQLLKPSCELVEVMEHLVNGVNALVERGRWSQLSYSMASRLAVRPSTSAQVRLFAASILDEYRCLTTPNAFVEARLQKILELANRDFIHFQGGPWRAANALAAEAAACSETSLKEMRSPHTLDLLREFCPRSDIASWIASIAGVAADIASVECCKPSRVITREENIFARALRVLKSACGIYAEPLAGIPLARALHAFLVPKMELLTTIIESAHRVTEKQMPSLIAANGFDYTVRTLLSFGRGAAEGGGPTKRETAAELIGWMDELGRQYACHLDLKAAAEWLRSLSPDMVGTQARCESQAHAFIAIAAGTSVPTARGRYEDLRNGSAIMSFDQLILACESMERAPGVGADPVLDEVTLVRYAAELQRADNTDRDAIGRLHQGREKRVAQGTARRQGGATRMGNLCLDHEIR